MDLPTKFFRDKIWVSIVIPIVAILGFLAEIWGFLDKIMDFLSQTKLAPYPSTISIVLIVSLFFIAGVLVAIPVLIAANEKRKFKDAFKYICEINLIYRDNLFDAFYDRDNEWNSNVIKNGKFVNTSDITIRQDQPCNVTDKDSLWNQQIVERRAQHPRSP